MLDYPALKPHSLSHLVDSRVGNVDADAVDLLNGWDFTDGWADTGAGTIISAIAWATLSTGGPSKVGILPTTKGKTYKLRFAGTSTSNSTLIYSYAPTTTLLATISHSGEFDETVLFTTIDGLTGLYLRSSSAGTTTLTAFELSEWSGEELVPDEDVGFVANTVGAYAGYGGNTLVNDGNAVKMTYVDDGSVLLYLRQTTQGTIFSDLIIGQKYRLAIRTKALSAHVYGLRIYDGSSYGVGQNSPGGEYGILFFEFTAAATNVYLNIYNFGTGDVSWIEVLSVMKVTGLVASYNFLPSPGAILVDTSGNGNEGAIVGTMSSKDGLVFDVIDDYIQLASDIVLAVSGWTLAVRLSGQGASGTTRAILGQDFSNSLRRIVFTGADELYIETDTGGDDSVSSGNSYNENIPVDYVITVNAGVVRAWQDGVELTMDDVLVDDLTVNRIGRTASVSSPGFGFIDMQIYNEAKNAQWAKDYHNQFAKEIHTKGVMAVDYGVGQDEISLSGRILFDSGEFSVHELSAQDANVPELDKGAKYLLCDTGGSFRIPYTEPTSVDARIDYYNGSLWARKEDTLANLITNNSWLSQSGDYLVFTLTVGDAVTSDLIKKGIKQ